MCLMHMYTGLCPPLFLFCPPPPLDQFLNEPLFSNGDWPLRHQRRGGLAGCFLWCLSSQSFLLIEDHVASETPDLSSTNASLCVPQTVLSKRLAPQCLHFDQYHTRSTCRAKNSHCKLRTYSISHPGQQGGSLLAQHKLMDLLVFLMVHKYVQYMDS